MSLKALTRVWSDSQAKGGDLLVLLAIADEANDDGLANPSTAAIAKKSRLDRRQVRRIIRRLEKFGELRTLKSSGGWNVRNKYFLPPVVLPRKKGKKAEVISIRAKCPS